MFRFLSIAFLAVAASAFAQDDTALPAEDFVVICTIEGMIDDGIAVVVERAVKEAAKADALIFEVDTFGGRVDSAIKISEHIASASCPTIAYIKGKGAISAGALISYACDDIIMAPGVNIGASTPFTPGAEAAEQVTEKSMSFLRAKYRALAEVNGHDPLIGEAMVDNEIELRGVPQPDGGYKIFKVNEGETVETSYTNPKDPDPIGQVFEAIEEEVPVNLDGVEQAARELIDRAGEDDEARTASATTTPNIESLPDGSILVTPKGKLLTFTSGEAEKFGLIPTTANSVEEVMGFYGYPGLTQHRITPTWAEDLYRWLTSPLIAGILLMMGLGGLYIEIRTPGIGLPALIGVTCLAILFGSFYVIGLAEWLDLVLVLCGIVLILVEIFVLPGVGIVGMLGAVSLIAGAYLSLTRVTIPQYDWDYARIDDAAQTVVWAMVLMIAMVAATWKILPRTPFYGWTVAQGVLDPAAGYIVQDAEAVRRAVGLTGIATSPLRPAGRGRFDGTNYDIVTRGEFLEKGTRLRIIQAEGNRYVVAAMNEEA